MPQELRGQGVSPHLSQQHISYYKVKSIGKTEFALDNGIANFH